jgi:peptidoglycan/LPS O-acetylase OafA/YrhL
LGLRAGDTARGFLPWVQALRAFAAFAVAFVHIAHDDIANGGDPAGVFKFVTKFFPWDAGVDVFFVISGFVIVHASARLFGVAGSWAVFLRRRLARIVPLYWVMTTAFLAVLVLSRDAIHGDIGGVGFVLASYLFLPWPRPDGVMQPAFGLGWTLNYEMFFYLLFAPFLLLGRRRAVIGAGILLCVLVTLGPVLAPLSPVLRFWCDPILMEFVFGMELALIVSMGFVLPFGVRVLLVIGAVLAFHLDADGVGVRPIIYGLPAMALVAAAALLPASAARGRVEKMLVRLGDASYAMYLAHPFVMRGFTILWHRIHAHNEITGTIYVLAGLAVAQGLALFINATLERRIRDWFRRGSLVNEVV